MSKTIKILGTGCPKCQTMTSLVKDVVTENNIDATIEKVEDIMEIMKFNVMTTPALVIDDVITIKGRIPSKDEVLKLLN
ncbi:thioredoxin family protein [uncultured Algibacter sp.]|uniref:thioredoxin family protein n=1 Tax=uncultured Algibacter sp. TaxID=298659 RepID=UPI002604A3A7|nr:thioredoxin family protein [uncultured Algibacter sp.]